MNKITSMKHNPSNRKLDNPEDDFDDYERHISVNTLGYFEHQQVSSRITVPIDNTVREPSYYRNVVNRILNTTDLDIIEFEINTNGGSRDGLVGILSAMDRTQAETTAYLNGSCHSAGSLLALSCSGVVVSEYASMLVHFVSYGAIGKASDIYNNVMHEQKISEKLFRKVYKNFLSDDEINSCIDGKEIWLDADQIIERLENRQAILMEASKGESANEGTCSLNKDQEGCKDLEYTECNAPAEVEKPTASKRRSNKG